MSSSTQQAPRCAVDAERWPGLAVPEGSAARTAVARALFTRAVAMLPIIVRFPDGRLLGAGSPGGAGPPGGAGAAGGPATPVMILHRPGEFFRRFGASGLIGFGESYMAGDWDCADLTGQGAPPIAAPGQPRVAAWSGML